MIGTTEEHRALAASVRGVVERGGDLAAQGLYGLHLPEEHGGQGGGLLDLAVVVEELGRALVSGPFVPTVLASAVVHASGRASRLLGDLAKAAPTASMALFSHISAARTGDALTINGTAEPVLGAEEAGLLVLPAGDEWVVIDADQATITPLEALDITRGVARVTVENVVVPADRVLGAVPGAREIAAVILCAEAAGIADWCVATAAEYAKIRTQFGRPIGQFQGVKHKIARMLVELERARAAVWDAARHPVRADVASVIAPDAAVSCAQDCIQVHGGIGYTWEHDAHRYYRRALTLRVLVDRSPPTEPVPAPELELPDGSPYLLRAEHDLLGRLIQTQIGELAKLDGLDRVAAIADGGWGVPHLPRPWGRDAGPLEQVLIHRELRAAGVRPPTLAIGAWVVPALASHGTPAQKERFLRPTLRGEILWCQLFSEPGAGSDLAGLTTRAERADGGWRLSGQKIWNSLAQHAQWAICLARTDPAAPKHQGITYFLVDMASDGLDVRPLKDMTGDEIFNEVFLDDVFVPDDLVVGEANDGWRVARTTLTAERVNLSTGWQLGGDLPGLVSLIRSRGLAEDPVVRAGLGRLICDDHVFALLGIRATLKQLSGVDPGATANVSKLVGMEHGQRLTEFGFGLLGPAGAVTGHGDWTALLLASRAMTIGGGTTEVNLNVIAERLLGLPRDGGTVSP